MKRYSIKSGIVSGKYLRYIIIITSLILFALSCISPFEPDYKGEVSLLVVDGSLIRGFDTQVIRISRAAEISEPVLYPVENCSVKIIDDSGSEFVFNEESPGKYVAKIDTTLLSYDKRYKLLFSTPSGENYMSDYQTLLKTAPVDGVYALKETHFIPESGNYIFGLQFYVDLDAPDSASRFYRWEVKETWEIHSWYMITGFYDGNTIYFDPDKPSDSLYYCWDSKDVTGIYTFSTGYLSHNKVQQVPLHFKPHDSPDMTIKYCATVRQFALNEDAYYYWNQKENEFNQSGQIYTTQPSQLKSNVYNINNPAEKVLGFFWVSSVSEEHLFEKNPFANIIAIGPEKCTSFGTCAEFLDDDLIAHLYIIARTSKNFPAPPVYMYNYVTLIGGMQCVFFSKDECIDCRLVGGTNHKPDFWK
jgi:hypothetical protein